MLRLHLGSLDFTGVETYMHPSPDVTFGPNAPVFRPSALRNLAGLVDAAVALGPRPPLTWWNSSKRSSSVTFVSRLPTNRVRSASAAAAPISASLPVPGLGGSLAVDRPYCAPSETLTSSSSDVTT